MGAVAVGRERVALEERSPIIVASALEAERAMLAHWVFKHGFRPALFSSSAAVLQSLTVLPGAARVAILTESSDHAAEPGLAAICRELKSRSAETRILCIRTHASPPALLFTSGADDLVCRPYDVEDLLARATHLLGPHAGVGRTVLTCGPIVVDVSSRHVTVAGNALSCALTAAEFDTLVYLLERREQVVTKEAIVHDVLGVHGSADNAKAHVCHIRQKLGQMARPFICTVRRKGYMATLRGGAQAALESVRLAASGEADAAG
jgi:DNA-binding response OmpR family regulator